MAKTKILAIGDIHGDKGLVKKLAKISQKEKVDIIILAGDLTFAEQSLEGIIGPFTEKQKEVLMIPGNHESVSTVEFLTTLYPNTKNLHGRAVKKGDIGIFGAGSADIGVHAISDEEIFELLKKSHEKIKNVKKKIMVTHMPPLGSKAELVSGFKGSLAVRKAIEYFKPDIAITSHIHEGAGMIEKMGKTKVINVSRKEKIIEV